MSETALAHALRTLAALLGDQGVEFSAIAEWARERGLDVTRSERNLRVHFPADLAEIVVSFGEPSGPGAAKRGNADEDNAFAELVAAMSDGSATQEIDAAVGWDPELAV